MTETDIYKCLLNKNNNCNKCEVHQYKLHCKIPSSKYRNLYWTALLSFSVLAFVILSFTAAYTDKWWIVPGYIILGIAYLYFDLSIHCSHCDYYVKSDKRKLTCILNRKLPKIFRSKPRPMNIYEKIIIVILYTSVLFFPFIAGLYGIYYTFNNETKNLTTMIILTISVLVFIIIFLVMLFTVFCKGCIFFSCPLNIVSKKAKEIYIKKKEYNAL